MLSEKHKAVATLITTASTNNRHNESYRQGQNTSTKNLRELIANFLIGLQAQSFTVRQCRCGWQLFEVILRQYYDLKIPGEE